MAGLSARASRIRDIWFWPRLARAEPDVVLRVDDELVVVEAKYRSGRHDTKAPPDGEAGRLGPARRAVHQRVDAANRPRCVSGGSWKWPSRNAGSFRYSSLTRGGSVERTGSSRSPSVACRPVWICGLATWQRLFHVLSLQTAPARWAVDLMAYLEIAGLDSFVGIGRRLAPRGSHVGPSTAGGPTLVGRYSPSGVDRRHNGSRETSPDLASACRIGEPRAASSMPWRAPSLQGDSGLYGRGRSATDR